MNVSIEDVEHFWDAHTCELPPVDSSAELDAVYSEVSVRRYKRQPEILGWADFGGCRGKEVLEVGCGAGSDGVEFARAGARYTGVDLTENAVRVTRDRLRRLGLDGRVLKANSENLPFETGSFDRVWSFGVIHHSPSPDRIVHEIWRVLRDGGTAAVMVYNRNSMYYRIEVAVVRRLFFMLCNHDQLFRSIYRLLPVRFAQDCERYVAKLSAMKKRCPKPTSVQWLSMNTDDVFCPMARVYSESEARQLFSGFQVFRNEVGFVDRENWLLWRIIAQFLPCSLQETIRRRWGWFRMIFVTK